MDRWTALWQLEDNDGRFLRIIVSHGTFWAPNSDDGLVLGGTSVDSSVAPRFVLIVLAQAPRHG